MAKYEKMLTKGLKTSLSSTPIEDGKLRYTTDTGECFLDFKDSKDGTLKRLKISDIVFGYKEAEIKYLKTPLENKLYLASDSAAMLYYTGSNWMRVGGATLSEDSQNKDYVLWFSSPDSEQPMYNTGITFNPSTNTLSTGSVVVSKSITIGKLVITDELTEENDHNVDFDFVV